MNNSITRLCGRIIEWEMPVLVVCIALALSPSSYTPLLIKSTLLQCGAVIYFTAWAISALERRTVTLNKHSLMLIVPAFFFMLSAIISFTFVTSSRDTSIDELMVRVPYFLIFFVTAVSFTGSWIARRALLGVMVTGFVVALNGMLQHFGCDPFGLGMTERISATFGNPNFYVGFLVMAVPAVASAFDFTDAKKRKKDLMVIGSILLFAVAYYLCVLATPSIAFRAVIFCAFFAMAVTVCLKLDMKEKTAAAITLFLLINNIFLADKRSGQIGLGAAIIVFAALTIVFIFRAKPWQKTLFVSLISLFITAIVVLGVRHISYSNGGRLGTVSQRKYYVQAAIDLIKRKPVLGYGIGTFKNNYPLVKPRESWRYNALCFEHVSNVYNEHLEVLHDEGLIGFLIYAWMLAVFFILSIMAIRVHANTAPLPPPLATEREPIWMRMYAPKPAALLIGLLSGVAAVLISNIFSLSMRYAATGFMFWLFLGLLAAPAAAAIPVAQDTDRHNHAAGSKGRRRHIRFAQTAIVVVAIVAMVFSVRIFFADVSLQKAVDYSHEAYTAVDNTSDIFHDIYIEGTHYRSDPALWELALSNYQKTLLHNPFYLRARYFLGNAFNRRWNREQLCNLAWGDRPCYSRTDAERALEQYDYVYKQAPHYVEIDLELGDLYRKLGNVDRAIAYYNDYKRYHPFFTKIHYALAYAYVAKNDWAQAAEAYKDALDLNKRFTQGYLELCAVYHKMGKEDLAADMFEKAREISPDMVDRLMTDVWENMGEPDLAMKSCLTRITHDSADVDAHFKRGLFYIRNEEWQKAISTFQKVVALDTANTLGFINLSNLYFQTGRLEDAKDAYQKAMAIDPELVRSVISRHRTNKGE